MAVRVPGQRARKQATRGAPGWMTTLADMFMLLLTFFILMLSFSSLDNEKYRAMVASMMEAFNMAAREIPQPSGMADPEEVVVPVSPDVPIPLEGAPGAPSREQEPREGGGPDTEVQKRAPREDPGVLPGVEQLAGTLISEMEDAVANDQVRVGFDKERVVIRFDEGVTFPVGSAELIPEIRPVVERIVNILSSCEGEIVVTGHTDDRPIISTRYRSNWDLSAARAVSLVHELVLEREIAAENVIAAGRAETRPIASNATVEGRESNRRVEIEVYEPDCETGASTSGDIDDLEQPDMKLTPPSR